eukprot:jgi/Undpi1/3032/HiC_scaffold_14.g06408.m1
MNAHCRSIVRAAVRACNQSGPKAHAGTSGVVVQQRSSGVVSPRVRCISTAATARSSSAAKGVVSSRGAGTSRSINRGVMWSTLATLGMTSVTSGAVASGAGSSAMRMLGTTAASTIAFAFVMPQGTGAVQAAGRGSDDDDDDESSASMWLRVGKNALFGSAEEAKGSKSKKEEQAEKLVGDLFGAVNDFRADVSKSVDGAEGSRGAKRSNDDGPNVAEMIRNKFNSVMGSDAPAQLSFGFIMGVCCGFAAKKTARVALVGVGLAFGSLQVLSYLGYVKMDYDKIEGEMMGVLDLDKTGKVDTDDFKVLYDRVMKVATYNLPAGSGFAAGALIGARL